LVPYVNNPRKNDSVVEQLCASIEEFGFKIPIHARTNGEVNGTEPLLMVTDPPYGISLDSEWRDRAGVNGCGAAEACYMKTRTEGHHNTTISSNTRADWSEAFELVPASRSRTFGALRFSRAKY
jgi:hypothetical protein